MKRARGMTGARMRELRKQAGWTQEKLASWLGVARNTVARMEAEEIGIPVTTARLLLLILDEKNQQKILSAT